ncbi:MAG: N-formylglutamate amidohydrolase [Myxococcales bacterium]|nr:N-formylglutamate amidohydrolase [Myxococcales bacterium]
MHVPPFRVIGDPSTATGPFIFTCEHASNRLDGVTATPEDRVLLEDHWGWDIGAAALTEALVELTGSCAVLSDFSRLIIDPNRPLDSSTLIVEKCGAQPVSFNQHLAPTEVKRRIERLHGPYHRAVETTIRQRLAHGTAHLVSMHSFTPEFFGKRRLMEVGVLFDEYAAEAETLGAALHDEGFATALNEPYTGKGGAFVYSIMRHGRSSAVPFMELEVRNDLLRSPEPILDCARRIARALAVFAPT